MLLKLILPLLPLLTFTLSSPVVAPRDVPVIIDDFNTISSDIAYFNEAVKAFQGSIDAGMEVHRREQIIEDDIMQTTEDVQAADPFTDAESEKIKNKLLDLEPKILGSLDLVVSKKAVFMEAAMGGIVVHDLNTLQAKTNTLADALKAKATPEDAALLEEHMKTINAAFADAIAAFS